MKKNNFIRFSPHTYMYMYQNYPLALMWMRCRPYSITVTQYFITQPLFGLSPGWCVCLGNSKASLLIFSMESVLIRLSAVLISPLTCMYMYHYQPLTNLVPTHFFSVEYSFIGCSPTCVIMDHHDLIRLHVSTCHNHIALDTVYYWGAYLWL